MARAALLAPATGADLERATALALRAAAADRQEVSWKYPYYQFVRGLAEYRQGKYGPAVATLRGDAARRPGPTPQLVLAMALHRDGKEPAARKALAAATLKHDWRANQVKDEDGWIEHALRREAEGLILPGLRGLLDNHVNPHDDDERLIMLGECQFTSRTLTAARLYAAAFAADPALAADFKAGHRSSAARYAALAGCGRGGDVAGLGGPERARWRAQAREWLRADLAAWGRALDANPAAARDDARRRFEQWRTDPDLDGLRLPAELDKLPADERKDCVALWAEVDAALARCRR